ncbi:MAG: GC-type dockerin domain-anchored protein [Phycisphaerales bacterium]
MGSGLCGDFFAFSFDSQTGVITKLPTSSRTTRADHVSADGAVVVGYDLNASTSQRRLAVWADGAETILDPNGYNSSGVAGNGSAVVTGASLNFSFSNYGIYGMALVKWSHSGTSWVPQNLGVPAAWNDSDCNAMLVRGVSNDGNTVIGDAYYGGDAGQVNGERRPFIWRPTINGGVPMDLATHLATLDPSGQVFAGTTLLYTAGLSADGNTVLAAFSDSRQFCEVGNTLYTSFAGLVSFDGSQTGNEPPRIAVQPSDWSTRCTWAHWGTVINVIAGGSWPLNYQWQREDPSNPGQWLNLTSACSDIGDGFPGDSSWDYEGASGMQLRVNVINGDHSKDGRYRCVISNAYGSVTSDAAEFQFANPINPQGPYDTLGCTANPAVFSVTSVGGGAEYNWQYCTSVENDTWLSMGEGTVNLPAGTIIVTGVRTRTVTIDPGTLAPGSQHLFRCHIADSCNSLDTNPATLTVGSPCGLADLGQQGGVPALCGDQSLDNNDFIVFITFFFNGNPAADQGIQGGLPGHDGHFDNNDFIAFINNFFHGCTH